MIKSTIFTQENHNNKDVSTVHPVHITRSNMTKIHSLYANAYGKCSGALMATGFSFFQTYEITVSLHMLFKAVYS